MEIKSLSLTFLYILDTKLDECSKSQNPLGRPTFVLMENEISFPNKLTLKRATRVGTDGIKLKFRP
jgi:hypothetical protein